MQMSSGHSIVQISFGFGQLWPVFFRPVWEYVFPRARPGASTRHKGNSSPNSLCNGQIDLRTPDDRGIGAERTIDRDGVIPGRRTGLDRGAPAGAQEYIAKDQQAERANLNAKPTLSRRTCDLILFSRHHCRTCQNKSKEEQNQRRDRARRNEGRRRKTGIFGGLDF